jgi:hypothetical protein
MRMLALTLLAGLALVAGAGARATSTAIPTAGCDSIVTPGGTFSWRPKRVVLGVVAVPPRHIPQTVESGADEWPYWSKSGIVIRADSPPVVVSVPRRWRSRAAISWGNVGEVSALRFASCPGGGPLGDWNPYTGGFLLRSPAACLPLTFRVGDRVATVRFGVGKRCG